jgi:hypothetical protein
MESLLPCGTALSLLSLLLHSVADLGPRLFFLKEVVEQLPRLRHRLFVQIDYLFVRLLLQRGYGRHGRDDGCEDIADGLLGFFALWAIQHLFVTVQDLNLELEELQECLATNLLLHDGSPSPPDQGMNRLSNRLRKSRISGRSLRTL